MRVYIGIFTGLFTNPQSDDCGMMPLAKKIAALLPTDAVVTIVPHGWDELNPDQSARAVHDDILLFKPDKIILLDHSFGCSLLIFFCQWLMRWLATTPAGLPFTIDLAFLFDPCKNPLFGLSEWWIDPEAIRTIFGWFQNAGRPFGVSGTPLEPRLNQTMTNVTHWANPTLAHVSMLGWTGIIVDSRVQAQVIAAASKVLSLEAA